MNKDQWFPDSCNPCRVEPAGSWTHNFISGEYMRYCIALQHATQKDILDAGCGVCYGSSLLSLRANNIICANLSQEELNYGKEMFKFYCPVNFACCDLNKDFPNGKFDLIVSFEMIEHLSDPMFFINNVKKNLKDDGKFIFSVPKTDEEQRYINDVRIGHLYSIQSFQHVTDMFNIFRHITWYFQMDGVGGIIGEKYMTSNKDNVLSWIGICQI